ncbi:MAG: hypothetical protein J6M30_08585 [Bacteroidales bacterium]|nr:hypothetical protein [Bacteroidales bacterium]
MTRKYESAPIWALIALLSAVLAMAGRLIALTKGFDDFSANVIFTVIFLFVVAMYFIFQQFIDEVTPIIGKKIKERFFTIIAYPVRYEDCEFDEPEQDKYIPTEELSEDEIPTMSELAAKGEVDYEFYEPEEFETAAYDGEANTASSTNLTTISTSQATSDELEKIREKDIQERRKLNQKNLDAAIKFVKTTMAPYISSNEDVEQLCQYIIDFQDSPDFFLPKEEGHRYVFPQVKSLKVSSQLKSIDYAHLAGHLSQYFRLTTGKHRASFVKVVFAQQLENVSLETLIRKQSSKDKGLIPEYVPEIRIKKEEQAEKRKKWNGIK